MIEIDDSLYSRQRYVLGDGAMRKLASGSVLLVGLGGVGVEIAKNLVLAGVKSLCLLDGTVCCVHDMSSQFFVCAGDVQSACTRAEASMKRLAELNPYVEVKVSCETLEELSFLDEFQCVIMTESSLSVQKKVNEYCRSRKPSIAFLSSDVYGLICWTFCDFGGEYEVVDVDGEEVKEVFVSDVTKANPGVVTTLDERLHGLVDGDHVSFKEVKGMSDLGGVVCPVKVLSATTFSIHDTTSCNTFSGHCMARQVKVKKMVSFESLSEQVSKPTLITADFSKPLSPLTSHLCHLTLHSYKDSHADEMPKPWDEADCVEFLKTAESLNCQMHILDWSEVDHSHLKTFSFTCAGQLACLCAFVGGVTAQECIKSLTNKYTPLQQWLYMDAIEVCPDTNKPQDTRLSLPKHLHSRYYREVVCIGEALFTSLTKQQVFMVGCGAIGCELLKNFALLGLSTNEGKLTISDYDLIEKSNLNRQFLFRPQHIRQPKSTVAAKAVTLINPDIRIESHQNKVCWETEASTYTDAFISHHDVIVNALDNLEARKYMDGRCVTNGRPLLESGTMATKGHVQVIVPFMTESYTAQSDHEDGGDIPYCTLKSFPSNIEHCIEWAREKFESLFAQKVQSYAQFWDVHPLDTLVDALQSGQTPPAKCKPALKLALEMTSPQPPSSSPQPPSSSLQPPSSSLQPPSSSSQPPSSSPQPPLSSLQPPSSPQQPPPSSPQQPPSSLPPPQISSSSLSPQQLPSSSSPLPSSSSPLLPSSLWISFITQARLKFEKYFNHKARDLLNAFPLDIVNNDGSNFWQLPKRPPSPLHFSIDNPLHISFIKAFSLLKASVLACVVAMEEKEEAFIKGVLRGVSVPPYVFKKKHIETDENVKNPKNEGGDDNDDSGDDDDEDDGEDGKKEGGVGEVLGMAVELQEMLKGGNPPSLRAERFEKDDDSNEHINLISALANLRACSYQIEEKDRLEVKRVAGKIVPAIATTTAAVAAMVTVELLKVVKGIEAEHLRNSFLNLALPLFVLSQPAPPLTIAMSNGLTYTQWDRWVVKGTTDSTLAFLLSSLKKAYKLQASLVVHGVKMVFSADLYAIHKKRLIQPLLNFIKTRDLDKGYVDLVVSYKKGKDVDGKRVDEDGPPVRFQFV